METQHSLQVNDQQCYTDSLQVYEDNLYNLIEYMFNNSIFNTFVTNSDNDNEFSIILHTHKPRLNQILGHLGKYSIIKFQDTILTDICPICCDEFKVKQYKRILNKCSHCFHKKCIDKWFRKNQGNMNCPLCRTNYNRKIEI